MKLEQSFEVAAPLDHVWAALIDVERVAPCLPGADISGRNEDGSYNGTFRVKIGPTAAAYAGKLEMEKIDEPGHTATMQAQGTDRRGQGGAKATIFSSVSESGPGTTLVDVVTEYHITGRLARFGRGGMIEEISARLLREFAKNLQEMVAAPAEAGAYETFVGMPAVGAESPASQSRTTGPPADAKPKRRTRRDLAAAADAVAAASQPPVAPEPVAAVPEPAVPEPAVPEPPVPEPEAAAPAEDAAVPPDEEVVAEEELAAVVPEASQESQPPAAEVPEPVPPPTPEPVPPEPPPVPEPPPTPEPPAPPPPPAAGPPPTPPPPAKEAEPLDGLALGRTVLIDRIKSNPAPLIVFLLALLLLGSRRRRRRRS